MAFTPLKNRTGRLNTSNPLTNGLVFAMSFFEGDGTPTDSSNQNIKATLTNAPTWTLGKYGREMKFAAASDQYINLGNPTQLQITDQISVAVCFKLDSIPANAKEYEIVTKDKDTGGRAYTMDLANNSGGNGVKWYINGGGGSGPQVTEGVAPAAGDDKVSLGTYSKATGDLILYINGKRVGSVNNTAGIPTATANVLIGRREYTGFTEPFDGRIRYVYIWHRALTQQEVWQIYIDPFAMFKKTLRRTGSSRVSGFRSLVG